MGDLFQHRYLFVQHVLTPAQRGTLVRITRGRPELRTLRGVMDETYRLFDRRCRTDTALEKLARLRRRVRRFRRIGKTLQKLFSPNLEKALTFWMTNSCLPHPTQWNAGTAVIARCRKPCIVFALSHTSPPGLPWTCNAKNEPHNAI